MTRTCPASDWDPLDPGVAADPMTAFSELRSRCPVAYSDRYDGFWSITKYDDLVGAGKDTATYSSRELFMVPDPTIDDMQWLPVQVDPPEHREYRGLLQPFFARGRLRAVEEPTRAIFRSHLEAVKGQAVWDAYENLTFPYPAAVLCLLLGFPREDQGSLGRWTSTMMTAAAAGDRASVEAVVHEMYDFIDRLREARVAEPGDPDEDVMTSLIQATHDGEPLTAVQTRSMLIMLLNAGHSTTTHGTSNLIRHLATDQDDQARLRADPSAIPSTVEEVLRMWSPVAAVGRTTTRDVELRGRLIPQGSKVSLLYGAAGRDDEVFDEPHRFDPTREGVRHLAFGAGPHRCIGAELARLEMRIAAEELLAATTSLRLHAEPEPTTWPRVGVQSLQLEVTWEAGGAGE